MSHNNNEELIEMTESANDDSTKHWLTISMLWQFHGYA